MKVYTMQNGRKVYYMYNGKTEFNEREAKRLCRVLDKRGKMFFKED